MKRRVRISVEEGIACGRSPSDDFPDILVKANVQDFAAGRLKKTSTTTLLHHARIQPQARNNAAFVVEAFLMGVLR